MGLLAGVFGVFYWWGSLGSLGFGKDGLDVDRFQRLWVFGSGELGLMGICAGKDFGSGEVVERFWGCMDLGFG